jgi:putative effector of murein hydrolase LrgA (UPF0299 family)
MNTSIDIKVRILVFAMSLLWLLFVLRMVKRRKIWERYAIFWVYMGFGVLFLPLLVDVFDALLYKVGVSQPPNFFFLVAILGILLILLQLTVEITTLVRRSRDTVQELAILEERVRRLERGALRAETKDGVEEGVAAPSGDAVQG